MVIKVKVSDVAAGFGVQNKEVLDLLAQCGAAKKSPSTVLEEGELNALFDRITKTHSVENFDKFYALRSNKPKSQAPQQKKEKKPQSAGNTETEGTYRDGYCSSRHCAVSYRPDCFRQFQRTHIHLSAAT